MENGSKCPKYFCEEFLKNALDKGWNRTDVKVLDFNINLASFGGENYCSDIYRIKVDYVFEDNKDAKPDVIHLILKDMKIEFDEMAVKSKETTMYQEVVPQLEAILGGKEVFAPKLFMRTKIDSEIFVFQDLNAIGYELKDRIGGLSEDDCIFLLKKIGKMHATSMIFAEKFPDAVEKIKDHMVQYGIQENSRLENHCVSMLTTAYKTAETWEGYESIADKIKKLIPTLHDRFLKIVNPADCRYKVINHGDLWVNNFLFKGDDVAFIDLQLSNYGSPAHDVNYFLNTSVPVETLKSKRYEFLRTYFKEFEETLKSLDYENIPSCEDFMYEMRRLEFAGIWVSLIIFPLITLNKESSAGTDISQLNNVEIFEEKKRIMFGAKRTEETLKYIFDRYNEIGALD